MVRIEASCEAAAPDRSCSSLIDALLAGKVRVWLTERAIGSVTTSMKPITEDSPCGPDLDALGDSDFLLATASIESQMPLSYFAYAFPEREEDQVRIDIPAEVRVIDGQLARTHDLRLWTLKARLQVLGRRIEDFTESVVAVADLLDHHWDQVHPRADDGSFDLRRTFVESLGGSMVVFALQFAPLISTRRSGPISWRSRLLSVQEVKPRAGEIAPTASVVAEAFRIAEADDLQQCRDVTAKLARAVATICAVWQQRCGESLSLDTLVKLSAQIATFVAEQSADEASPTLAAEATGAALAAMPVAGTGGAPAVGDEASAAAALDALADYYRRAEPSNPALTLIKQAQHLRGRSFFEALQSLVPRYADEAMFRIGTQMVFDLSVSRVAAAVPNDGAVVQPPASSVDYTIAGPSQALALMKAVGGFYRLREPTSPIPWLLDRAVALAGRDFLSLLRDVLPKSALRDIADQ